MKQLLASSIPILFALTFPSRAEAQTERLLAAAMARTKDTVTYNGSYRRIAYPGGDVPRDIGVCTDLIVRVYRAIDVDLQEEVHRDMRVRFHDYPSRRLWGLKRPDPNIDHRRVPNLEVFFARHGTALPVTGDAADYAPGDLVTWILPGNLPHIGLVSAVRSRDGKRPLIIHNIGAGPKLEDTLFDYPINAHYRYALPPE